MGVEYAIRFAATDPATVAAVLHRLPMARELSPPACGFELRAADSSQRMTDASVQAEPYGLYFCDYGGHGRAFLGLVIARPVEEFGAVTVEELG
jgi:hypothetical protein